MILARRARPDAVTGPTASSAIEECLSQPLLRREWGTGRVRGVYFGDEAAAVADNVSNWMDDGLLGDSLHVGGFHGNSTTSFALTYEGRVLHISPAQLARAVENAVPGTTLTYDHLVTCCAGRPGASGGLYAQLRNRPVLAYDEIVGVHNSGRYLAERVNGVRVPLPYNFMQVLNSSGRPIGISVFRGMRSTGDPVRW